MLVWNTAGRLRFLTFTAQRTGSWGSWLTCEPRPEHKVGFIREKGKAAARAVQWSLEAGSSLLMWSLGLLWMLSFWVRVRVRWDFSVGRGFVHAVSLRWAGLFAPYGEWGTTLRASYLSALWQVYETLHLLLVVQECRFMSSLGCRAHSALHGVWGTDSLIYPLGPQTQQHRLLKASPLDKI
jgi:hypothetical protein